MKKFYLFLTLLFTFVGFPTSAFAQEDDVVTINVMKGQGDWLVANAARTWAAQWQSSTTPKVLIKENSGNNSGNGANNMAYWDGTNIQFFNNAPNFGDGLSDDYVISVESGWEFVDVSLNFVASADSKAVYIAVDGEKSAESASTSDQVHFDFTFPKETSSFVFTVGANTAKFFAKTTDFVIHVKKKEAIQAIIDEIKQLTDAYREYTEGEGHTKVFVAGTEVGNYGAAEVAAFNAAYSECITKVDDPEFIMEATLEDYQALYDNLKAAYEAVLASQVTFVVPENLDFITDGYYRFRTGMNYQDGLLKYMFTEVTDNGTINGKWGTLDDLAENCNALWQLTKTEAGTWDIVSVATDGRFNANPATLSEESEYRFVLEGVAQVGEETFINIKYSTIATGGLGYVHQAGHSSGKGTGSNLTSWYPTFTTTTLGASEWCIELVPAEEAAKIIEEYAFIKEFEKRKIEYIKMVEEGKANLEIAKDNPTVTVNEEVKLINKDGNQFSSPWTSTAEGVGAEDYGWNGLLDGDKTTYWHSDWTSSVPNHTHYLDVALNEPTHDLIALTISRREGAGASNHITQWGVYGSTTPDTYYTEEDEAAGIIPEDKSVGALKSAGEWHKLADLYTPYGGSDTETVVSSPFDTKGYQYLRFYIDQTSGQGGAQKGFGHVSEFQLNPTTVVIADNAQYAVMGEIAANLEKVLSDQIEVEVADLEPEQYTALKDAFDAFMAQFVDPTALRAAIQTAEASAAGIVVGNNPGEWGEDTDAGKLATTVANAKTYDASGKYNAEQSAAYVENLKSLTGDILASANKIQTGKWYRIHFGSKETAEKNGWDIDSNEPTTVKDKNETSYVTNEALWDKYFTVAKYDSEKITIEVTHTPTEADPSTSKEQDVTLNKVVPYEEGETILSGARLYLDADADIKDRDCSLFRFVNVGDTAYVLQNKATGLFVGAYSGVHLDVIPSLFKVTAIGYGQNLISATNLITNAKQNNLHAQRDNNIVVTWSESAVGSRSGLYIEEAGDVAEDYDGTEFYMNLKPGSVNSFCYPVGLKVPEDYEMYDVVEVSEGNIKLNPIAEAGPGRPFIFIADGDYDAEQDAEPYPFYHDYSFTKEAIAGPLLKGTYGTIASLPKGAITTHANGFVVGDSDVMSEYSVPAYTAYIQTEEMFPLVAYTYEILAEPIEDGINTALQKVATTGELYTIDGRLISRKANLNDLKRYGKGIYILNGVKVTVK